MSLVEKGVTAAEHVEGCLKVKEAGISCSVYIMPGLGGKELSQEHALETARVISAIEPDYVRLRTLEIFPSTPLGGMRGSGSFPEASEEDVVLELKTLIENINCSTEVVSDSATNLLSVFGRTPQDKASMLKVIDSYLELSAREKLEFSFGVRLNSFLGQYGSLSEDIYSLLLPHIEHNSINIDNMNDLDIIFITKHILSKLMP